MWYMKSFVIVALAACVLAGCGSHGASPGTSTVIDHSQPVTEYASDIDYELEMEEELADVMPDDFTVKEIGYYEEVTNVTAESWYFLEITNHGERAAYVTGIATGYDKDGELIAKDDSGYITVLGPGETSVMDFYFTNPDDDWKSVAGIDHVEYELSCENQDLFTPVLFELSADVAPDGKHAMVTVVKNGDEEVSSLVGHVFSFAADGTILYHEDTHLEEDTLNETGQTWMPFDTSLSDWDAQKAYDHLGVYLQAEGKPRI